jgi:hypothetical protein
MLRSIIPEPFGSLFLPVTIIGYVVWILRYYKHDLVALFSGDNGRPAGYPTEAEGAIPPIGTGERATRTDLDGMPLVEEITAELRHRIVQAYGGGIDAGTLEIQVREVLDRYPHVKDTPYEAVVDTFVRRCYEITTPLPSRNL